MKSILIILIMQAAAFGFNRPVTSFGTGEMSPRMKGRTDLMQYRNGCAVMENMFTRPYGGAEKRPGTKYIEQFAGEINEVPDVPYVWPARTVFPADSSWGMLDENNLTIIWIDVNSTDNGARAIDISRDGTRIAVGQNTGGDNVPLVLYDSTGNIVDDTFEKTGDGDEIDCIKFSANDQYIYGLRRSARRLLMKWDLGGALIASHEPIGSEYLGGGQAFAILSDDRIVRVGGVTNNIPCILKADLSDYDSSSWSCKMAGPWDSVVDEDLGYAYFGCSYYPTAGAYYGHCLYGLSLSGSSSVSWKPTDSNTANVYCVETYNDFVYCITDAGTTERLNKLTPELALVAQSPDINAVNFWMDYQGNICVWRQPYYIDIYSADDLSFVSTVNINDGGVASFSAYFDNSDTVAMPSPRIYDSNNHNGSWIVDIEAGGIERLIPFEYSTSQSYVIALGNEYIGFFKP